MDNDRVIDSRSSQDGLAIRRRRQCVSCSRHFTTYERTEETTIKVIKKDGSRVPFEREKIKRGLERACWKRPITTRQIEATTLAIENDIYQRFDSEVESRELGEIVMRHLTRLGCGRLRAIRERVSAVQRRVRFLRRAAADAERWAESAEVKKWMEGAVFPRPRVVLSKLDSAIDAI